MSGFVRMSTGTLLRSSVCVGFALTLLAFGTARGVAGQSSGSEVTLADEGALFLLFPHGAEAVGLSRAMTAVKSADAAFWNPAGLAGLEGGRALLHRGEHIIADATTAAAVLGVGTSGRVLGLAYQFLDYGSQELTEGPDAPVGSISVRGHQGVLSAASPLGSRIDVGANLKFVRFEVVCRGQCPDGRISGQTWASDLGVQLKPLGNRPLLLGAALVHLGPDFGIEGAAEGDPLPARYRLAGAYEVFEMFVEEERITVTLLAETEDRLRDPGSPVLLVATEFSAGTTDRILVRGGYSFGDDGQIGGAGVGLGLRYDRMELDIARTLARQGLAAQEEPVHLTLRFRF
ncbi:MAG: hypothetical protein EA352_08845 [Gemmatimonadales bacterium]|nr:MAG: hypothetical protein EA352_08845 [Gemmatimonadales bacterium]